MRTPFRPCSISALAVLLLLHPASAVAQERLPSELDPVERRMVEFVRAHTEETIDLLERTVNINSGTLNLAGVREVARVMEPDFEALGFDVRWVPLPPETGRAGHLIAERRSTRAGAGKSLLLIGHLDTVFEPGSPFQRFERDGDTAHGPGVADMKGGNAVIVLALRAMDAAGALDGTNIIVVLTGDEEAPGRPLEVTRRDLREAAERSDIALGFEAGSVVNGVDHAVVARRSSSSWRLEVRAGTAHSSTVFRDGVGPGAIYEAARIFNTWYGEIRGEEYLTFNVGVVLGGADVEYFDADGGGTSFGKTNIIPEKVIATGDIRTISAEQLERTRERMRSVVERSLPETRASIEFTDGYPSMFPTDANYALLERFGQVSLDLGYGEVEPFDPGARGAADISFVADLIEAGLDGLGPVGSGGHTVEERLDLRTIPKAAERAAVLMYRLTHTDRGN
jgi:glutamate carboxypeptidase